MLTAARAAFNSQFYDVAIDSIDRTDTRLDFNLHYLAPSKETTERCTTQAGIDPTWVYSPIRQENCFATDVQSSVDAQDLMQVIPATACEITGKTDVGSEELYTMDNNIHMGIWYMSDVKRRPQGNEVMAAAGYNAGPAHTRNWQTATPLEGPICTETIPLTGARDYVKGTITNTTYYVSLFSERQTSPKQHIGTVPARH